VEIDPEEEQRPDEDSEDRGADLPPRFDVLEVVVRGRSDRADHEPDQGDEPESWAFDWHGDSLPGPLARKRRECKKAVSSL